VQSANGTYQASDRAAIDTSVQQYLSEITRIANQTSFNGTNVLNGSVGQLSFQIGSNVGQAINVQLGQGATTSQLGQVSEISTANVSGAFVNASGVSGQSISLSGLTIEGADGKSYSLSGASASSAQGLADAINAAGIAGVSAAVNASGGINLYSTGELAVSGSALTGAAGTAFNLTNGAVAFGASGVGSSATGFAATGASYTDGSVITASGSLAGGDVLTVDDANNLISRVDVALTQVSNFQSQLGGVQNRFQSTIATLGAEQTNLTASQSSIQDTDFAATTAQLSKSQVLQQAGISVLATANAQPQQILKLLG
jgi:flagellin